ncbi:hypothetical protein [Piscinibacter sp.]|uniref:hypothetical protein n=1 Tax=Piscinibacter sp. TaxID=1903157 RepID=UPI002BB5CBCF|nr:hypothetical protein [Albitalea sp.]HUG24709.1 hypothetical protein [Albitalea sp.]
MNKSISKLGLLIAGIAPLVLSSGAFAANEAEVTVTGMVTNSTCFVTNVTRTGGVSWTTNSAGLGQTMQGTLEVASLPLDVTTATAVNGSTAVLGLTFSGSTCVAGTTQTVIRPMLSGVLAQQADTIASDILPGVGAIFVATGYGIGVSAGNGAWAGVDFTAAQPGLQALNAALQVNYGFRLSSPSLASLTALGLTRTAGKVQTAFQIDVL